MNQDANMNLIPSKIFAPSIHNLMKLGGADQLPKNFKLMLKREAIAQWIPPNGSAATQGAGLCYTTDAFRKAIENIFQHFDIPMTDAQHHLVDETIASKSVSDDVYGNMVVIEDLGDNEQVGFAMRQVQGGEKPKALSHPSLTERCKLLKTTLVPTKTIEIARTKMSKLSQSLHQATHQDKPLVGFDVEMFEHNHSLILEVGLALIKDGKLTTRHLVIDEHRNYTNGQYVPDNRDSFHFGDSEVVSLDEASSIIESTVANAAGIFGHSVGNDLRILKVPGSLIGNLPVHDTQDVHKLFAKAVAGDAKATTGLSTIAPQYLGDSAQDLPYHNAGNDIEVTGRILLKQGDPGWVNSQYKDLSAHDALYKEEQLKVGRENLQRCISMFKKHFKEACELTGLDVLEVAEEKPLQALDGFALAMDSLRRAQAVKMVHAGVPMLDYLWNLESSEQGVSDMMTAIRDTSAEYAADYLKIHEVMVEPSKHRQMIRVALEMPDFIKTLTYEDFKELKATSNQPEKTNIAADEGPK